MEFQTKFSLDNFIQEFSNSLHSLLTYYRWKDNDQFAVGN